MQDLSAETGPHLPLMEGPKGLVSWENLEETS